jgi:hypothetical protein
MFQNDSPIEHGYFPVLSRTFQFPGSKRVFSISLKLAGKPVQHLGSSFHLMRINSLRSEVDIKPQLSGFS